MGVVYLAEDTKLERQVAIKFLPRHIAANSDERKRFEIEAKAAAALNHPNIATIHAIEEADNELFLVMEYIFGKHLKDHINNKPLPVEEAVDIAIQIAKGLQAAHKKGIVHRDIKSANIMSTDDGHVRIMDFGLAKFRGSAQLTQVGTTLGTAAYMSPEQARGEEADQRSDIWSFGIVFYEMLTGQPPFKGEYEQALIYNLLNEEAPPLKDTNPAIPGEICAIVEKCLQKERHDRYRSMDEVLSELKSGSDSKTPVYSSEAKSGGSLKQEKSFNIKWPAILAALLVLIFAGWYILKPGAENARTTKKMLAILPFENLGNTEDEYFADGITGEITSKLSGLSGLGVIARSSAMQYKNSEKDLQQIAGELGVDYILEGTVQWEQIADGSKRVRVNPELIEINNATQIWSKPYEADFSNVFELQAKIASTVAEALNLKLLKSEKKTLEQKITDNPAAYDLYLRAVLLGEDITNVQNTRLAEKLFLEAVGLDNNFAAAYAGLSIMQSNLYWEYAERTRENLDNSKTNALKALEIDPDLPMAHVALAHYYYHGKLNYESALEQYNQALKLQPDNVAANNGIGFVYRRQGKMREAIGYFVKTFKLDPRNYTTVFSVGETYNLLREYDKGTEFLNKAISLAPNAGAPIFTKAKGKILDNGDISTARELLQNAHANNIGLDYGPSNLQLVNLDLYERNFAEALTKLEGFGDLDAQFNYKPGDLLRGFVYLYLDNKQQARRSFSSAVENLQEKIRQYPDDSRLYTSLGLAYAGLGQKEKALSNGKRGVALLPIEKEAWRGTFRLLDLAQIYVMVGEHKPALQAIDKLLSLPTDALGIWPLKLDPVWDPIRGEQGYKKLIEKHAEKDK